MSSFNFYLGILLIALSFSSHATIECAYLDYPPYAFEQNGNAHGIIIEILQNIDRETTFSKLPAARLFRYLETGEKSCGLSSNIALSKQAIENNYYLPLLNVDTHIFYLRSHGTLSHDYFRKKTVGVIIGVKREKTILKFKYNIIPYEVSSPENGLEMLIRGRLDGLHMSASSIINLKKYDSNLIAFVKEPSIRVTAGFFINKTEKIYFEKLKRKSKLFFKTKAYKGIVKKYLKQNTWADNSYIR